MLTREQDWKNLSRIICEESETAVRAHLAFWESEHKSRLSIPSKYRMEISPMYQFKYYMPLDAMERISRQYLCNHYDEVLERVDKEDIGFVIQTEEGEDGHVLCPARWMEYCFDDDFGCIINSALRYAISRHTYMPSVVERFIRKYINLLDTKTMEVAIEDISKALAMNEVDNPDMWERLKTELINRKAFLQEKASEMEKLLCKSPEKEDEHESTEHI